MTQRVPVLPILLAAGLLTVSAAVLAVRFLPASDSQPITRLTVPVELSPMCPWREPEADMRRFFPQATGYSKETRILSAHTAELTKLLGRRPTGEDLVLYLYRIRSASGPLGTVLVRRVKGEFGAIEIVIAADVRGGLKGIRLQRLREPGPIAGFLEQPGWLRAFRGMGLESDWSPGAVIPAAPPSAKKSAAAIVEGVRSQLALLEVAETVSAQGPHH